MYDYKTINSAIRTIDRRNSEHDVVNNTRLHIHRLCSIVKMVNKYIDGQLDDLEEIQVALMHLAKEVNR